MTQADGSVDLTTKSRHAVFRKITENAVAAIQHYNLIPQTEGSFGPEVVIGNLKHFVIWIRSYKSLWFDGSNHHKCDVRDNIGCGKYFNEDGMVPTWRDLKNLRPYHEGCKPLNT